MNINDYTAAKPTARLQNLDASNVVDALYQLIGGGFIISGNVTVSNFPSDYPDTESASQLNDLNNSLSILVTNNHSDLGILHSDNVSALNVLLDINSNTTSLANISTAAKQDTLAALVATATKQDTGNTSLANIDTKVSTAAKQDTLAALVATATKQDTGNTSLANILTKATTINTAVIETAAIGITVDSGAILSSTPAQLVAAPGANKRIVVLHVSTYNANATGATVELTEETSAKVISRLRSSAQGTTVSEVYGTGKPLATNKALMIANGTTLITLGTFTIVLYKIQDV